MSSGAPGSNLPPGSKQPPPPPPPPDSASEASPKNSKSTGSKVSGRKTDSSNIMSPDESPFSKSSPVGSELKHRFAKDSPGSGRAVSPPPSRISPPTGRKRTSQQVNAPLSPGTSSASKGAMSETLKQKFASGSPAARSPPRPSNPDPMKFSDSSPKAPMGKHKMYSASRSMSRSSSPVVHKMPMHGIGHGIRRYSVPKNVQALKKATAMFHAPLTPTSPDQSAAGADTNLGLAALAQAEVVKHSVVEAANMRTSLIARAQQQTDQARAGELPPTPGKRWSGGSGVIKSPPLPGTTPPQSPRKPPQAQAAGSISFRKHAISPMYSYSSASPNAGSSSASGHPNDIGRGSSSLHS